MQKKLAHRKLALAASRKGYKVQIVRGALTNNLRLVPTNGETLVTTLTLDASKTGYADASVQEVLSDIRKLNCSAQIVNESDSVIEYDKTAMVNDAMRCVKELGGEIVAYSTEGLTKENLFAVLFEVPKDRTSSLTDRAYKAAMENLGYINGGILSTDTTMYGAYMNYTTPGWVQVGDEPDRGHKYGTIWGSTVVDTGKLQGTDSIPAWVRRYYKKISKRTLADLFDMSVSELKQQEQRFSDAYGGDEIDSYLYAKSPYLDALSGRGYELLTVLADGSVGYITGLGRNQPSFYIVSQDEIEACIQGNQGES